MAAVSVRPAARLAASTPQNVSPAPVLSTADTAGAGRARHPAASATTQPAAPSVTMATAAPAACSANAASAPWWPVSACASSALATATAQSRSSGRMSHGSGAVFRISLPPAACVARHAAVVVSADRLPCISSHPPAPAARIASCGGRAAAQAPAVTMLFSPSGITSSTEQSVAGPGRGRSSQAKPSACSTRATRSPSPSSPSGAMKPTGTSPARQATTAWFNPLPPGALPWPVPTSVSPGRGIRATARVMSSPALPSTTNRLMRGRGPPPA